MQQTVASDWCGYVGLGIAALDWMIAVCWPQTYRSLRLYRHFSPWEETTVICLMAASAIGFVASLMGAFRRGAGAAWPSVAGMVLNVPPFLVFGFLCRGLDLSGF